MSFAGMPSGPMGMPNPIAGLEDLANEVGNTFNGAMNSIDSLGNWVGNGLSSAYHAFDSSFLKERQTYAVNAQLSIINSIDPNDHSLAAEYARAQAYENMGTAMAAPTNYADIAMQAASILPIGVFGRSAEVFSEAEPVIRTGTEVGDALPSVLESSNVVTTGSPPQLVSGQAAEVQQLAALNSSGKVPFTPTADQVNSAAFKVIVGEPQYTEGGDLVGTIYDGLNADGLAEIKTGSSALNSSYQLRLQTYGSLVNDQSLTIYTSRPVNSTFQTYLNNWGVSVKPLLPSQ